METQLDTHHDLQLEKYCYDGTNLVAEVSELIIGPGRKIIRGNCRYLISFYRPVAHLVTEEFPAVIGQFVNGSEIGFLRRVENENLRASLGLGEKQFDTVQTFALITAHEILLAFCEHAPEITLKHREARKV